MLNNEYFDAFEEKEDLVSDSATEPEPILSDRRFTEGDDPSDDGTEEYMVAIRPANWHGY